MQKQKTQVRQYLSESFKQSHLESRGGRQTNSLGASLMRDQMRPQLSKPMEQKSQSLEFGQLQLNGSGTPGSSGANQQFYFPGGSSRFSSVTASPSEGAMSPSMASSVVTSGSEVSGWLMYYFCNNLVTQRSCLFLHEYKYKTVTTFWFVNFLFDSLHAPHFTSSQ